MSRVHAVRAHIEGEPRDLRVLAGQFDAGAARVWQEQGDRGPWFLGAAEFEGLWGQPVALHEAAVALLRRLNGAARVVHPSHRPARLTARYHRPGNSVSVISVRAAVEMNVAASLVPVGSGVTAVPPRPPPGPGLVALGQLDSDVAEVLELMGTPDKVSTSDMWKVIEVVRENVGGVDKRKANKALRATGWLTEGQWDSPNDALHNPAVSGAACAPRT